MYITYVLNWLHITVNHQSLVVFLVAASYIASTVLFAYRKVKEAHLLLKRTLYCPTLYLLVVHTRSTVMDRVVDVLSGMSVAWK